LHVNIKYIMFNLKMKMKRAFNLKQTGELDLGNLPGLQINNM